MDQQTQQPLEPRMEEGKALVIAGVQGRYSKATSGDIPKLWERVRRRASSTSKSVWAALTYGVCHNPRHDEFDYIAGVEVPAKGDVPSNFEFIEIPPHHYAVFAHYGEVHALPQTYERIMFEWLPHSGYKVAGRGFRAVQRGF